jgi:hypothetical protein
MLVEGTEANELMSRFREAVANASPPEAMKTAAMFIRDNAKSPVSLFLLKRYFIQSVKPDYPQASELIDVLIKAQPKNNKLNQLKQEIEVLKIPRLNATMPAFSAVDVHGRKVSDADLRGKVAVVYVWSSWNYESQDAARRLRALSYENRNRLGIVGICIDASKRDCRNYLKHDSVGWSTICDERMFEGELMAKLGLASIPDNIIYDTSGRIIAHGLNANDLRDRLEELLKKGAP